MEGWRNLMVGGVTGPQMSTVRFATLRRAEVAGMTHGSEGVIRDSQGFRNATLRRGQAPAVVAVRKPALPAPPERVHFGYALSVKTGRRVAKRVAVSTDDYWSVLLDRRA